MRFNFLVCCTSSWAAEAAGDGVAPFMFLLLLLKTAVMPDKVGGSKNREGGEGEIVLQAKREHEDNQADAFSTPLVPPASQTF